MDLQEAFGVHAVHAEPLVSTMLDQSFSNQEHLSQLVTFINTAFGARVLLPTFSGVVFRDSNEQLDRTWVEQNSGSVVG